ncbi:hypothetical protein FC075_03785 [Salmonella enterica]|nr:hypothetical protein [Salmonella enterica]ECS6418855.1 hypothetical protein [Salmonella enterica subsp. diarizonae serovar 50:r:z]EDR5694855.1 hypothetical protein [Salmonella enterica subsp. diarizonae]EAN1156699.1 hypothetical protein [Salmonella enterica]EAO7955223.1 hypothetical protein [Salmonella enterica]
MAERGGFEPPVELPLLRFSRPILITINSMSYFFFVVYSSDFHPKKIKELSNLVDFIYQQYL